MTSTQALADRWFSDVWGLRGMDDAETRRAMFAQSLAPAPDYVPADILIVDGMVNGERA